MQTGEDGKTGRSEVQFSSVQFRQDGRRKDGKTGRRENSADGKTGFYSWMGALTIKKR